MGRLLHRLANMVGMTSAKPVYIARVQPQQGMWWPVDIADAEGNHLRGGNTQAADLEHVELAAREVVSMLLDVPEDSFEVRVERP